MARIEKTVFISYRRTNVPWALAIFQYLTANGYDVFFDYTSISSGDFEQIILENIKARAHFIVILTPSALERCDEPGDWLRREIETALETQRNIVPLMFEGFDFGSPSIAKYLTGKLAELKRYNALNVPADYFSEAMGRLCTRYLNIPSDAILHSISDTTKTVVKEQQAAALNAAQVDTKQLTAQEWLEKGTKTSDPDEKIHCYTEAIRLKPDYAEAYIKRGTALGAKHDVVAALNDYTKAVQLEPDTAIGYRAQSLRDLSNGDLNSAIEACTNAIRLNPKYAEAYNSRGHIRYCKGDLDGAITDCTEAIRLKPDFASAYRNRGFLHSCKGELDSALKDYCEAIRLWPDYVDAYNNRGIVFEKKGDLDGAIKDYSNAIRFDQDYANAYYNRAKVWELKGDEYTAMADYKDCLKHGGGTVTKEAEEALQRLKKKLGC